MAVPTITKLSTGPDILRLAFHSLSRPSPSTRSRFGASAVKAKRQGRSRIRTGRSSARRLISRVLISGRLAVALAWPKRKKLRFRVTSPEIRPPSTELRILIGPVTVAAKSSRAISAACWALMSITMPMPSPAATAKLKLPLPLSVPPPAVVPVRLGSSRREPSNWPVALILETTVPVRGLSSRALLVLTLP